MSGIVLVDGARTPHGSCSPRTTSKSTTSYELHDEDLEYGVSGTSIGGGGAILSLWRRR